MTQMLSPDEMDAVYQRRAETGDDGRPYILHYDTGRSVLTLFGCSHSNDPNDDQWPVLENEWEAFAEHDNPNKVLLYENRSAVNAKSLTKSEALKNYSESGLVVWLANQYDIASESPEPDRVEEVEYLRSNGHSDRDIMTYYFARQMLQWLTQDKQVEPSWKHYASETTRLYGTLGCWGQSDINLTNVLAWFHERSGKEFDPEDRRTLYDMSQPLTSKVSADSGSYRDEFIKSKITKYLSENKDVFMVYGSGHVIRLEPVLDGELEKTRQP